MGNKERGEKIRHQIIRDVRNHPTDLTRHISTLFNITPQAVGRHVRILEDEERLMSTGRGKGKRLFLGDVRRHTKAYFTADDLQEDRMWRRDFEYIFDGIKKNVVEICYIGFTEMVNNAIDHSGSEAIDITVDRDKEDIYIAVSDIGEGIFRRIKRLCELEDDRHALFELTKGKLTTDPNNHTGLGIFFTSRAFDHFNIKSMGLRFRHDEDFTFNFFEKVPLMDNLSTFVVMSISRNSSRNMKDVYAEYTGGPEEHEFNRTVVPINMAEYGAESLVSRSQAKRVLTNLDKFKHVALDFSGIDSVGQAFADEIFRVYTRNNPEIVLTPINMSNDVMKIVEASVSQRRKEMLSDILGN